MSARLPIVDILADCETDRARAEWLNSVPHGVILRDCADIRAILATAGFTAGVRCLEAEFAALTCRRLQDGSLPFFASYTVNLARIDMAIAVRASEASGGKA